MRENIRQMKAMIAAREKGPAQTKVGDGRQVVVVQMLDVRTMKVTSVLLMSVKCGCQAAALQQQSRQQRSGQARLATEAAPAPSDGEAVPATSHQDVGGSTTTQDRLQELAKRQAHLRYNMQV